MTPQPLDPNTWNEPEAKPGDGSTKATLLGQETTVGVKPGGSAPTSPNEMPQSLTSLRRPSMSNTTMDERIDCMRLCYAARDNNVSQVRDLLSSKVDPSVADYEDRTALHLAALNPGAVELINILLDNKADVNARDTMGQTALSRARQAELFTIEKLLVARGAEVGIESLQQTADYEHWAIPRGEVKMGKKLSSTLKSEVYLATWRSTNVVAKLCIQDEQHLQEQQEIMNEISILAKLRHPDLVMFLGACLQESPIMFITEYMPVGDLEHYYQSKRREKDALVWHETSPSVNRWGIQVSRALTFMHNCHQPIIHRDLKPLNLLLTSTLDVKVTDFGISTIIRRHRKPEWKESPAVGSTNTDGPASPRRKDTGDSNRAYEMTGGVGSWRYMAPEVTRHEKYTEKVDIYSFGLILYFMSSGRVPFHEFKDPGEVLKKYTLGEEPRPKTGDCHASFRSIMEAAWRPKSSERPSAEELVELLVEAMSHAKASCGCSLM
eukprot:TRINITY_DN48248_c0_g1_i1.p1 TRINITY_DN48248_c0_g1~~TRINITY_DN48248_c0_g1_i1.p1  ORF type:complete len:494 (+),score=99.29 TRINITY_DN48248_c0_g1_i1:73-1554(+)